MFWNDGTSGRRVAGAGRRRGLTLMEMVVVLFVLVALAGLIVPLVGHVGADAQQQATRATLSRVAQAIVGSGGYAEVMRYARDSAGAEVGHASGLPWPSPDEVTGGRADHPQLHYLFEKPAGLPAYDPVARVGWNGPWLDVSVTTGYAVDASDGFHGDYGEDDDRAPTDGWGNPVVIQLPSVAAGVTDEEIDHVRLVSAGPNGELDTPANTLTPTAAQKNDDLVLYLLREDPNP